MKKSTKTIELKFERTIPASPRGSDRDVAGAKGLEPAASCVTGRHSNQLNYAPHTTSSNSFRFPLVPKCSIWPCRDRASLQGLNVLAHARKWHDHRADPHDG